MAKETQVIPEQRKEIIKCNLCGQVLDYDHKGFCFTWYYFNFVLGDYKHPCAENHLCNSCIAGIANEAARYKLISAESVSILAAEGPRKEALEKMIEDARNAGE